MTNTAFDWQIDDFMVYCRSRQLREKTMLSYEQSLRLFERWCKEQLNITEVDKVTESVVRCYINDLQERGKYLLSAFGARVFLSPPGNPLLYPLPLKTAPF